MAGKEPSSQTARATLVLREMIVQGRFRPGERIREIPLAEKLKVSRIPLRLALQRLAHEGFLEIRPTRGFVVQQFSRADIYDAIELRGLLEGEAARLAAERLRDDNELAAMRVANREMESLVNRRKLSMDDLTRYIDLNETFHSSLLELSRSRLLRRAMEQVCLLPFASPSAFLMQQQAAESRNLFMIAVDQHHAIIDAISNREGMRAETLAREHARIARRNLDAALSSQELLQLIPGGKLVQW